MWFAATRCDVASMCSKYKTVLVCPTSAIAVASSYWTLIGSVRWDSKMLIVDPSISSSLLRMRKLDSLKMNWNIRSRSILSCRLSLGV